MVRAVQKIKGKFIIFWGFCEIKKNWDKIFKLEKNFGEIRNIQREFCVIVLHDKF